MNTTPTYDFIVLGGGPAGYGAAVRAAQLGASVLLIEKGTLGGTCLHTGCVPTKFLWEMLHLEDQAKKFAEYNLIAFERKCLFPLVQQRRQRTIDLLSKGLRKLLESHAITVIDGTGTFSGPHELTVTTSNETRQVTGKNILITTGSSPRSIPGYTVNHDTIIDSSDLLAIKEVPKSLLIVGGGAIGVEFATVAAGFGSEVTIAEREGQLLPGEDQELAEEVKKMLLRQGIKVHVGVSSLEELSKGKEKILIAVGRQPNVTGLTLEKAGVTYSAKGIAVNEYQQTSAEGVYAAGDVAGKSYLAYLAQGEGIAAAENALGGKTTFECSAAVPRVVFGKPPIASVGAKEKDLQLGTYSIGRFPLAANSRAFIEGERTGWIKILSDKTSNTVLGGQMIAPHAEDLISIIALAVKYKMKTHELSRDIFFHPSIAEAIHGACEDTEQKCVDLPKKA